MLLSGCSMCRRVVRGAVVRLHSAGRGRVAAVGRQRPHTDRACSASSCRVDRQADGAGWHVRNRHRVDEHLLLRGDSPAATRDRGRDRIPRPHRRRRIGIPLGSWGGVVAALLGVVLIADVQLVAQPLGIMFALLAAGFWAGYVVLGKAVAVRANSLESLSVGWVIATGYRSPTDPDRDPMEAARFGSPPGIDGRSAGRVVQR